MPTYKRFITHQQLTDLRTELQNILESSGLFNKLDHLYSPDTDMNDKICEDLETMKHCIKLDLCQKINKMFVLIRKIDEIKDNDDDK